MGKGKVYIRTGEQTWTVPTKTLFEEEVPDLDDKYEWATAVAEYILSTLDLPQVTVEVDNPHYDTFPGTQSLIPEMEPDKYTTVVAFEMRDKVRTW